MSQSFSRKDIFPNVFSACVFGALNITVSVSLAALIFNGELSKYLPVGVGLLLVATSLPALIIAIGSSIPGVLSAPKVHICAIVAGIAGVIATRTAPDQTLPTIVLVIAVSTIFTGIALYLVGHYGIGNLIRFIPYPVTGGYIAGIGFLLVRGAFPMMTDVPISLRNIPQFAGADMLRLWAPGVGLGLLFIAVNTKFKRFLVLPALLFVSIAAFYILLAVFHVSAAEAREMGYLFPGFSESKGLPPFAATFVSNAGLKAAMSQTGNILAIVLVSAITTLLMGSGVEIGTKKDMQLDRDLKAIGLANIVSGFFGGIVSMPSSSETNLSYRFGARSRLTGILCAAICGAALFFGPSIIAFLPKPVLGGLLVFQGGTALLEWVFNARQRLPLVDYFLVLTIMIIIGGFGFLPGVAAGIVIAAGIFVVSYSRTSVIKYELCGSKHRSKVGRVTDHRELLSREGGRVRIFTLQGYIFFGTADKLLKRIKHDLAFGLKEGVPLQYVILDFRLVTNIDTSAVNSFIKMKEYAGSRGVALAFTGANAPIRKQLDLVKYFEEDESGPLSKLFSDVDHALEWCEDRILLEQGARDISKSTLTEHLERLFSDPEIVPDFMKYLVNETVEKGDYLFRQGNDADKLYFVESGKITIMLELESGGSVRLRTMGGGTVIGEMGLYGRDIRSASAFAADRTELHSLSKDALARMNTESPGLKAEFHRYLVRSLAERLERSNDTLRGLISG